MIDIASDEDHVPPVDPDRGHPEPNDKTALLELGGATQSQEFGRQVVDHLEEEFDLETEYRSDHAEVKRIFPGDER